METNARPAETTAPAAKTENALDAPLVLASTLKMPNATVARLLVSNVELIPSVQPATQEWSSKRLKERMFVSV